jgi:ComF family protein
VTSTPDRAPRWRRLADAVLDLLYAPCCETCGSPLRGNRWLCDDCGAALPRLEPPFCQRCAEPIHGVVEGPVACPNCHQLDFAFQFARPAMRNHPETRQLVHALKYERRIHLGGELGRLAAGAFADPRLAAALDERWPLVPVPLHPSRRRQRRFNQAGEIARAIARQLDLPLVCALRRVRNTDTQTRLSRAQRLANLRGAFRVGLAGRRMLRRGPAGVVLVDDVFTTGATTHECARTLRRAGTEKVVVVTVMRG